MPFRVEVDPGVCEGHGLCLVDVAEVFQADAEGYATVVVDEVADELRVRVDGSVRACPASAITITG